jgi:hypothetical protein
MDDPIKLPPVKLKELAKKSLDDFDQRYTPEIGDNVSKYNAP